MDLSSGEIVNLAGSERVLWTLRVEGEYSKEMNHKVYPSDVSDDASKKQLAYGAFYLTLMSEAAPNMNAI